MGTGECAPLTVGVGVVGDRVGAAVVGTAQEQSLLLPTIDKKYPMVPGGL